MEKDRGYAWVVLVMSFLAHSVHQGFYSAVLGNLTVAQQVYFNIDLQSSSLIGSVHTGLLFLLAPLASVLIKKFGCRFTQILAGVLAVSGMGLSYFSTQPWHAHILFGVITATGISFSYVTSSEVLSQHFDKKKHLAFSVAVIGSFLGGCVWPVGSQYLLDKYGYSKAMGIMAVPHVLHIVAGICFISPKPHTDQKNYVMENSQPTTTSVEVEEHANMGVQGQDNEGHSISMVNLKGDTQNRPQAIADSPHVPERDDDLQEKFSAMSVLPDKQDVTDIQKMTDAEDSIRKNVDKEDSGVYSLIDSFLVLLRTPSIWILLINAMAWNVTNTAFYVLINDYILKTTDLETAQVAFGITLLGIAKLAGSMLVAATSSLKYDRLILHIISVIIYSIITITITYSHNKLTYYLFMATWGMFQGAGIANLVSTIVRFCGSHLLAVLFGLELCAEGIGSMALTPLATYIGVKTGEKYALIFAGAVGILGSIILVPLVFIKNRAGSHTK